MRRPYELLDSSPEARDLFGKIMGSRIRTYNKSYGTEKIPCVGVHDFISTHYVLCEKSDPLCSFSFITLADCLEFRESFPLIKMALSLPSDNGLLQEVESRVKRYKEGNPNYLGYIYGRFRSSKIKKFGDLSSQLETALYVYSKNDLDVSEVLILGADVRGSLEYYKYLGYEDIGIPNLHFPIYSQAAIPMSIKQFKEGPIEVSEGLQAYWETRYEITSPQENLKASA